MTEQESITPTLPVYYEKNMDERHADLKDSIRDLEKRCNENFTKKHHFYWILGVTGVFLGSALCTVYYKITPIEIKAEMSTVTPKIDKILELLIKK